MKKLSFKKANHFFLRNKKTFKKISIAITLGSIAIIYHNNANAHGWFEYPVARQQQCYDEGGVWSGTPPNAGCAEAKRISGTVVFQQRNEYSFHVDYRDGLEALKQVVPDDTMCYANRSNYAGISANKNPDAWTQTNIATGNHQFSFYATASHPTNVFYAYLTKQGWDPSDGIQWDELEQVGFKDTAPLVNNRYIFDAEIPSDRSGYHVAVGRWSRKPQSDSTENFINCMDLNVLNDNVVEPTPPSSEQNLTRGELYQSTVTPKIGDTVTLTHYNAKNKEIASFSVEITNEPTLANYEAALADQFNNNHPKSFKYFVGDWHEEMSHYMYFNDGSANYLNAESNHNTYLVFTINSDVDQCVYTFNHE